MKKVRFAKAWKHVISATSYARYRAGVEAVVANHVAAIAQRDGVLDGDPVDVPAKSDEPGSSAAAAKKTPKA